MNLNWIINEIIQLHKQLDPDYTEPSFSQIYPFSNTAQLNLDWILDELKTLKGLAPVEPPTEEIDEIGQALLAGAYDAETQYQKNDYIIQDGKAYRATEATTGEFDATKWREVQIADDVAIITRWADATNTYLNTLAASSVANDSEVTGTTVKDALNTLLHAVPALTTDNVTNESDVPGATSTAALNALLGSLNTKLIKLTATLNSSVTSATIASWSNQTGITENSFVVEAKFSNPTAILSNITVTKDTGSVVLTGTTGASAGTIELIMGNE